MKVLAANGGGWKENAKAFIGMKRYRYR